MHVSNGEKMKMFDVEAGQIADFVTTHRNSDAIWLIHHIPKTAGSSLAAEVTSAVGADYFINLEADYSAEGANYLSSLGDLTAMAVEKINSSTPPRVLSGHLGVSHVDSLVAAIPQLKVISFLRHPVARVLSEYNYCSSSRHPLSAQFCATYPDIDAYLATPGEMNKAAHMMFGPELTDPVEAVARMKARYTMVGLQERYPASFLLMSSLIWGSALPKMRERTAAVKAEPDRDLVARIEKVNQLDLALYEATSREYDRITPEIWDALSVKPAPVT